MLQDQRLWTLLANSGYAVASFLLGWLLLQQDGAAPYGAFAFFLVLQAFGFGVLNALVASPLLILWRDAQQCSAEMRPHLQVGCAVAVAVALVQTAVLLLQALAWPAVLLLLLASLTQSLRWLCRCVQQNSAPWRVIWADLLFFTVVLLAVVAVIFTHHIADFSFIRFDLFTVAAILAFAALVSLLPGAIVLRSALDGWFDGDHWRRGYQAQGKPALLGVVTAEIAANLHQYMILFWSGPAALAPVAAAGLYLRPSSLLQASVLQAERPAITRQIGIASQQYTSLLPLWQKLKWLQWFTLLAISGNILVLLVILMLWPHWLWPDTATLPAFWLCLGWVSVTALVRAQRGVAVAFLQGCDDFHYLSRVTVVAALYTVPLLALGLWLGGIHVALAVMFISELMVALPIIKRYQQYRLRLQQQEDQKIQEPQV